MNDIGPGRAARIGVSGHALTMAIRNYSIADHRYSSALGRLLLLLVCHCCVSGCMVTEHLHHKKQAPVDQPTGVVSVSGPLAVARSFPSDVDGIPLSDVVEASLRPGFRALGEVTGAAVVPVMSELQPATVEETFVAWAEETEDLPDDIEEFRQTFVRSISRYLRETDHQINAEADVRAAVDAQILQLQAQGQQLPPLTRSNSTEAEKAEAVQELRDALTALFGDWNVPAVQTVRPQARATGQSAVSVLVSQRSGRRLVIPLRSVTLTAAGDIRVFPGEHVTVAWSRQLPPGATAKSTAASGEALIAVQSLTTAMEGLALNSSNTAAGMTLASVFQTVDQDLQIENSVMVTRTASDGVTELHLLPTPLDVHLGTSNEAFEQLREFQIADGDTVQFGVLELNPFVVQGRTLTRVNQAVQETDACFLESTDAAAARALPGLSRWHRRGQLESRRLMQSLSL